MKALLAALLLCVATSLSAADYSDAEWAQIRRDFLNRPRRVMIDDDGCDAVNFPAAKEPTIANFYAEMLDNMKGNEFDVLVYCPGTVGFCVLNRTATGHRQLRVDDDKSLQNITSILDEKFDTDPVELARHFARCNGYEFVLNMRANDTHDAYYTNWFSGFKTDHPELLVGRRDSAGRPPFGTWSSYDFALPQVRDLFKRLVFEWFDNYAPDGFMIDFMRSDCLFKSGAWGQEIPQEEREMFTQMLRDIRDYAEKVGRKRGCPIYFAFRVPDSLELCHGMGIDIERWMEEGLFDYLIAGSDYGHYTPWSTTAELCRKYRMRFFASMDLTWLRDVNPLFDRNNENGFNGQFANAYAAGAEGIYMFNMFYASSYFAKVRRNPKDLVTANKNYFVTIHIPKILCRGQSTPGQNGMMTALYPQYSLNLTDTTPHVFQLEVGDDFSKLPASAPRPTVRLCLNATMDAQAPLQVKLNGTALELAEYKEGIASYAVPPETVKPGTNLVAISASAQPSSKAQVILTGKEILEGANQLTWRRLFPGNGREGSEKIVDGAYRLECDGTGPVNLLYPFSGANAQDIRVAFEHRVEPGASDTANVMRLANGKSIEVIDFKDGMVRLRYAGTQCPFDTTAFHAYEVTMSQGVVTLYADGKQLLSGKVGENVRNTKLHMQGYHYTVPGMNEGSMVIGSIDNGAQGAGYWRNIRYTCSSLVVEDMMMTVRFPHQPSEELLAAARDESTPWLLDVDCTSGVFPQNEMLSNDGYGDRLVAAPDGAEGVLFDNDIGEYNQVTLKKIPEVYAGKRFMVAEMKLTCLKPPRDDKGFTFSAVLRPVSVKPGADGRFYTLYCRSNDGCIATPYGFFPVPEGAQKLRMAVDALTGETIILLDGKYLCGGHVGSTTDGEPGLCFGDGSSTVSGKAALSYFRMKLL